MNCGECGAQLKHRDFVKRIKKTKGGTTSWISVERLICEGCGKIHRQLPKDLLPYKHYDASIIKGVVSGKITPEHIDYEDYPCEMTMIRWIESQKKLVL